MSARAFTLPILAALVVIATVVANPAAAAASFDDERPAGLDINPKHQSNWEPTVAVDPQHAMAQAGETGSRHAPDVTKSEHGDLIRIL